MLVVQDDRIGIDLQASDKYRRSLQRYETSPKTVMKPPSVAQTMLKSTTAKVGIAIYAWLKGPTASSFSYDSY